MRHTVCGAPPAPAPVRPPVRLWRRLRRASPSGAASGASCEFRIQCILRGHLENTTFLHDYHYTPRQGLLYLVVEY